MMQAEMEIQEKTSNNRVWILSFFAIILVIRLLMMIVNDNAIFPINHLKIEAPYKNLSRESIQKILYPYLQQSYLSFSKQDLTHDLYQNPWVASVLIQKKWPDEVSIQISEYLPVAIYNDKLLSDKAVLFKVDEMDGFLSLPHFYGPENQQKDILQIYKKLSKLLVAQDLFIAKLRLRDNQAWEITLHNAVILRLGKQNIEERILRFVQVYPKLFAKRLDEILAIDLRYANGIAVEWKKQEEAVKLNPNNNNMG